MYQVYYKLICTNGRQFKIKNTNTELAPAITQETGATIYEWRLTNAPIIRTEDNLPSWYDPYPAIMISEFKNWKEVSDWARPLYPFHEPLSRELQAKVEELKRNYKDPAKQVLAALRFVQDDIRYMGIEMGENSHKPHQPAQILRQRFGDCKDKAYLLCTLLQALHIDAYPVLINSTYTKAINDWLPAPTIFDHVTVRVTLNNTWYWFDPTISFQRGTLDAITYPNYESGLVITDTTTNLTTIPFHDKSQVHIKEIFDIPNMSGKMYLKVVTAYSGASADNIRSDFESNSNYELRKTYTDFYASYFKNIKADSLITSDNEATGVFTTTEHYTIDSAWGMYTYMKQLSFEPYVINALLKKPDGATRAMPYALRSPAHYTEEIQVNLPEIWSIKHSSHSSESSAFTLHADYSCSGKQLLLKYDFKSLKDHIMPGEMAGYLQAIHKAKDGIAYTLTYTVTEDTAPSTVTSNSNFKALYLILGACVFITYTTRKRKW